MWSCRGRHCYGPSRSLTAPAHVAASSLLLLLPKSTKPKTTPALCRELHRRHHHHHPLRMAQQGPRPKLTHFLCIPVVTTASRPQLEAALSNFKEMLSDCDELSVPEKAIRPLETLHLTLGVMSLPSEERIASALTLLQSLDFGSLLAEAFSASTPKGPALVPRTATPTEETAASASTSSSNLPSRSIDSASSQPSPRPPKITLKGLTSMQAQTSTSILYAAPTDTRTTPLAPLQNLCNKLRDIFTTSGHLLPDNRPLLLHATILNTIYAKSVVRGANRGGRGGRAPGRGHGSSKAKLAIDATELLLKCEELVWMRDVRIEKLAIWRMGARRDADDGVERYGVEGERLLLPV